MALFSFIGVEVAAITAKRVKNPRVNVGRASLLGTGASAILYLVVSAAIMGLVPHHALVDNTAPFVTAFGTIFTHGAWAGKLVAALAVDLRHRRAERLDAGHHRGGAGRGRATACSRARSPGPTARAPPGSAC